MILVPQNTVELVNIPPRPMSPLLDMIRVVWTGGNEPKYGEGIQHDFMINKECVYNALIWLMDHNEDYRDIEMDKAEFDSTPLPKELLDELRWEDDIAQRTRSVYNL